MRRASLDFRNTNSLWGSVLVETLFRRGLTHAVISPGSRSTPLTLAFARHPGIESVSVLDERSAAFFALGLARQHQRPVVLLCTSGTAGANYFPAVIEAQESGVPLIVITADRPPEMRDCASGQTIDQQKLFGGHVNFYHEFAVPAPSLELLRYLRQTTSHAWDRALRPGAGPIHLNAPLRDPLAPTRDNSVREFRKRLVDEDFFAAQISFSPDGAPKDCDEGGDLTMDHCIRGVIVVGNSQPENPEDFARAIGRLSAALNWPVFADALSPVRHQADLVPWQVSAYDTILRSTKVARKMLPEHVLCVNGWPTSKVLRNWVSMVDAPISLLGTQTRNSEALHGRTRHLNCSIEELAASVKAAEKTTDWLKRWTKLETLVRGDLDRRLDKMKKLFEGRASRILQQRLQPGTPVFIANSMPVRDVEYFWGTTQKRLKVYVNRGANGIDGTLSTALGVAHRNEPSVLLTGDLALLHDSNGFLIAPKFSGSLTVVLINNAGGGIFQHLPVAEFDPPFEEFFATPQAANFRTLCAAHGVRHVHVRSWVQFERLISRLPVSGIRVLELQTNRKNDAASRKKLFADVAAKLEKRKY